MIEILSTTAPLYLCVLVGYLATRFGPFKKTDADVFGRFVTNVAMPALLFASMTSRPAAEAIHPTYLIGYMVTSIATLGLVYTYSRVVAGSTAAAAAFDGLGSAGSNSGFVGFPLLSIVLPVVAGPVLGMNVMSEVMVTLPLVFFLAELGRPGRSFGRQVLASLKRVSRMPMMIALVVGVAASFLGLHLPAAATTAVDLFARTSTALALFSVGGMLVGIRVVGNIHRIVASSVGKLLLMPGMAAAIAWGLGFTPLPALGDDLHKALILSAAMPAWSSLGVFAGPFGERDVPPAVLLLTTSGSFVTLSLLLALLG